MDDLERQGWVEEVEKLKHELLVTSAWGIIEFLIIFAMFFFW